MKASGHHTWFFAFFLLLAGVAPASLASDTPASSGGTSFGVGVLVVPHAIDPQTLPASVREADGHISGYARQWYAARMSLQAGGSIDGFISWSRQAMIERSQDPSGIAHQGAVSRLVLDCQRELMDTEARV